MSQVLNMARAEARSAKELLQTIASRSSDPDFFARLSYLPNPDKILTKLGAREAVYDDVATDAHVFAVVQQRKSATLRLPWDVSAASNRRADRKAADLCREVLQALDLEHLVATLLDAPLWGRAYGEVQWESDGAEIRPTAVLDRPQRRFVYTPDGELRLLTREQQTDGVPVPDRKILQARQWPTYDNPYGWAALSRCFWPWTFKHNSQKFWVILAEKFGIPFVWGKVARGASDQEVGALLEALGKLRQDGFGVGPSDGSVEILEANAASKGELHASLSAVCNAEISKAIIGQTLTSEVGQAGSYAASKTHGEVRNDIAEGDQRLVAKAIGALLRWTTELNVPSATAPTFLFLQEEDRAEWLKLIEGAVKVGLPVSRAFAHEKLQIPEPEKDEAVLAPAPESGPAGPRPASADDPSGDIEASYAADDEPGERAQAAIDALVARSLPASVEALAAAGDVALAVILSAQSYEGLDLAVLESARQMDLAPIGEVLARALLVADLNGRWSVAQEAGSDFAADGFLFEPLPFDDAIAFFKDRMALPAKVAQGLPREAQDRAFWVAGVQAEAVVGELHGAVLKALEKGTTLADFQREAAGVLKKAGLSPAGPYQLETVYRNQVQTAYSVGRYRQMTDPAVLKARPFWQYRTAGDGDVRPSHAALEGRVFRADDPIWDQIYPPNGHRCRCRVVTLSARQMERRGLKAEQGDKVLGQTEEHDGQMVVVRPDTGWNTNPGKSAWGGLDRHRMEELREERRQAGDTSSEWEVLGESQPERYGLDPKAVALRPTTAQLMPKLESFGNLQTDRAGTLDRVWKSLTTRVGGDPGALDLWVTDATGARVNVSRQRFLEHVLEDEGKAMQRTEHLPLLVETLRNPSEIWLVPMRSKLTGMLRLRRQYLSAFEMGQARRRELVVVETSGGGLVGWTGYPARESLQRKARVGALLWRAP
jgi:SPP1 gp7 family putative phage head morphogenesis protein